MHAAAPTGIALPEPRSLQDLASQHGGRIDPGAADRVITRIAPIDSARAGDLAPLTAARFVGAARTSGAALLVDATLAARVPEGRRWVHEAAAYTLARLLAAIAPAQPALLCAGAHIDPLAEVDPTAHVGPGAVILAGAVVGPHARIEPNAVIYGGSVIGARVVIGAGAVIGRPGFGWTRDIGGGGLGAEPRMPGEPPPLAAVVRVPQLGGVRIEEDAEVGPLATVDAGTLGPTVIGRGAKLDAHVHVGHNVTVGAHAMVAAQAGFAGSVRLGAATLVGGQAGVADHITIGDGARLAAKSGVIGDVPPGAIVAGYPAVDKGRWLRAMARILGPSKGRVDAAREPTKTRGPRR